MKKIYLFILMGIVLVGLVSATETNWGVGKQNNPINLTQICDNCSYVNITSIQYPNKAFALFGETSMTKVGTIYYYSFNDTSSIGNYIVTGHGDDGGTDTTWSASFEITPSGFINTLGFYLVILIILIGIILLGFLTQEAWFIMLSGMGFIMFGIYSINYGVVGFRDMFMTWGMGLFEIAIGAILSIKAGMEFTQD